MSASPFANQAMGSMSDLPSTSGPNGASTSGMPQRYSNTDFGPDINLWYQPSSDAVTRAGDVLGMPHLDGYTAKVGPPFCFFPRLLLVMIGLRLPARIYIGYNPPHEGGIGCTAKVGSMS